MSEPIAFPVTTPDPLPTLAIPLFALHTPPDTELLRVMVLKIHTAFGPVIVPALGDEAATVTTVVTGLPETV